MSKDPAVLFYTADFLTAIMTWDNEQVGMYIRLLCLQHQKGRLSEKDMLKICLTHEEDVLSKFTKDKNGYFNNRLEEEIIRRKKYSKSRSENRKGGKKICKTYDEHMETETITITKTENNTIPTLDEVKKFINANDYNVDAKLIYDYYNDLDWHDSKGNPVKNWKNKIRTVWFKPESKKQHRPY